MIRIVILLSLLWNVIPERESHEFHLSITEIEYVAEKQEIQIISRVFIENLEAMLHKRVNENIILDNGVDETAIDEYLERYLKDKLTISVDGQELEIDFLGKKYESESVHLYALISNVDRFDEMNVTNEVLFDAFKEQQNIIKLKTASVAKSYVLIPSKSSYLFNLN